MTRARIRFFVARHSFGVGAGKRWQGDFRPERNPHPQGVANNFADVISIRDAVEHKLLRRSDRKFFPLFQASCLNFDRTICELFGERLSLQNELSLALQFAKVDFHQIAQLQKFDIPEHIEALDAELDALLTDEEKADLDYRFRVVYLLEAASKSKAHFEFIRPGSDEGKEIRTILEKRVIADDDYPHKPGQAAKLIAARSKRRFRLSDHTNAWRRYKARPAKNAKQPELTNRDHCIYHAAHRDYTFNEAWVEFVVGKIADDAEYQAVLSGR